MIADLILRGSFWFADIAPLTLSPLATALIVQAVLGLVFLAGFVAIVRRYVDKEIPAQFNAIGARLGMMEQRLERVSSEFRSFELRIQHHVGKTEAKVDGIIARLDNLESRRGAGRGDGVDGL